MLGLGLGSVVRVRVAEAILPNVRAQAAQKPLERGVIAWWAGGMGRLEVGLGSELGLGSG